MSITSDQSLALTTTYQSACAAQHLFPAMAACEAMLESNWLRSTLARLGNNLFGTKQHRHYEYGTLTLPTREFIDEAWVVVNASWVIYPSVAACMADRMATLSRLSGAYAHYAAALAAPDPIVFVTEVSKSWSTDPRRAANAIAIYKAHLGLMENSRRTQ